MNANETIDNPFLVLDLPASASRLEIERAAQRWLHLLAVGSAKGLHYMTPQGERVRTEDSVRRAVADLRDPVNLLTYRILAGASRRAANVENKRPTFGEPNARRWAGWNTKDPAKDPR